MHAAARSLLVFWVLFTFCGAANAAATLHPGDIIVVDTHKRRILRVDPKTGVREEITSWKGDGGRRLNFPWGLAIDEDLRILIADTNARSVFHVDAATGSKKIIANFERNREPTFYSLHGIALDGKGGAYVSSTKRRGRNAVHSLLYVDLATGSRRVISSDEIGSGPRLLTPSDLAFEPAGTLLVNMREVDSVYRVDPVTGDRQVVSSPEVGSGPSLGAPYGIELLKDGDVLVTDRKLGQVARVDTRTGDRVILSSAEVGSGPPLKSPFGVAQAADGDLFVADLGNASIFHIELATGNRRLIASPEIGSGPALVMPRNLVIVPGEVSGQKPIFLWGAAILASIGGIALLITLTRRSRSRT